MKVILTQDVRGQGKRGQMIEVSDGYARNFLLPRKLAVQASANAINTIQNAKAAEEHRQAVEQLRTSTVTLKESEEKWEEGMISVFELMEKRNLYILAKAELSRTRLQYELKSRTVDFYRTGSFLGTE